MAGQADQAVDERCVVFDPHRRPEQARSESQPCTTTSSSATRPATSPGRSMPPAWVIPVHAASSSQAFANAASRSGILVRQSGKQVTESCIAAGGGSSQLVVADAADQSGEHAGSGFQVVHLSLLASR